jgi:glycosyltransferase involved in cell wall biosynthesis
MIIGFVIPDFRGGGAEKVIVDLANEASKENKVYLIVSHEKGPYRKELNKSIEVIETNVFSSIKTVSRLVSIVNNCYIRLLVGTLSMANAVALTKLFVGKKCTCVSRIGNTISSDFSSHGFLKRTAMALYLNSLIFSDYVVVQSEYMKSDIISFNRLLAKRSKIKVIYNPLSNIFFKNQRATSFSLRSQNKSDDYIYKFLAIGRLERQKDYPTMLRAFARFAVGRKCRLDILGDGYLRSDLIDLSADLAIKDQVFFHGFVDDVPNFLVRSDVFILTSLYEGFSNALLQAVASGLPVALTDSPSGNRELVEEGKNGFFAPVADSDRMYLAMLKCINLNPEISGDYARFKTRAIFDEYLSLAKGKA